MIGGSGAAVPKQQPQSLAVSRSGRSAVTDQIAASLLWFALFANWLTMVPVIIPDQIALILGPDPAAKEGISGSILAIGAFMALVMAPLAGALSDRVRNASGRRRPFLIAGMAGTCVGLALLVPFGAGSSILLYALAILNLQLWWNWACGSYAGLIPDVVPQRDQASASAWMNIMSILGTFTGNGIAVALYAHGQPAAAIAGLIVINVICLAVTVKRVREPPASGGGPFALGPFLRSFWLPPAMHRNFYRVLITRLFANFGVWSMMTFLLFICRTWSASQSRSGCCRRCSASAHCSASLRASSLPGSPHATALSRSSSSPAG
jgi:Major Facilitator Superfamily